MQHSPIQARRREGTVRARVLQRSRNWEVALEHGSTCTGGQRANHEKSKGDRILSKEGEKREKRAWNYCIHSEHKWEPWRVMTS